MERMEVILPAGVPPITAIRLLTPPVILILPPLLIQDTPEAEEISGAAAVRTAGNIE